MHTYKLFRVLAICLVCLTTSIAAHAASLTLAWDRNGESDIAGYIVYWGTQSDNYSNTVNVGNTTTYQVNGLADGSTYYFVVKAYNTSGQASPPSSEVSGQTSGGGSGGGGGGGGGGCTTCASLATDLNGDSQTDLVWQNESSRQVVVWYLGGSQGNTFEGWDWLASDWIPGWKIVGVRDFNSDGKPDLVWQNDATQQVVVWYMGGAQGKTFLDSATLAQDGVAGWYVVATGDFNGDGKPDLVWQNDARQVGIWYMGGSRGNTLLWSDWLSSAPVTDWRVVGAADFNGDGRLDLLWQHDWSRQAAIWYLGGAQGNAFLSSAWLTSGDVPGWTLAGTADFNRDGKPDLVWQNDDTRVLAVWYENGTTFLWGDSLGLASDPIWDWRVIAR